MTVACIKFVIIKSRQSFREVLKSSCTAAGTCCEVRSRNHKLVYPCASILRCSIARLVHFNACALNQARTQTFENGAGGGGGWTGCE